MASGAYYPPEIVSRVQEILSQDSKAVGPITQWGQALEVLREANIAYDVDEVHPDLILVHPDNRSKLGVNAFNVHRIGSYVKRVGADINELRKATAFELCPMAPKKTAQIEFNANLVKRSSGMLAPLSGKERYLSVSCGHTAQFCRAALASCHTPQPTIADGSGNLNVQHLCKKDQKFHQMIVKGWSWTILPWQAEATWPTLPDLAQRALNASNSVASQASELETAATIAEFAQLQASSGEPIDYEQCADAAAASMPPCASYCQTLARYVKMFGGGVGAPMVRYLDDFSKAFGENRRLGEEFIKVVTETQFSLSQMFPHVRTGLLASNLVSPKVTDGFARLLVKADVERLKSKDKAAFVEECEESMAYGWEVITKLVASSVLSQEQATMMLGRLHTRTILHMVGKAKLGFEAKEYANVQAIRDAFVNDLQAEVPAGTDIQCKWLSRKTNATTAKHAASSQPEAAAEISNVSDPAWVARQAGFEVSKHYYEKSVGAAKGIFTLTAIGKDGVELAEFNLGRGKPRTAKYPIDEFMKTWGEFKGELPVNITPTPKHMVTGSEHIMVESQKAQIFAGLVDLVKSKSNHHEKLAYSLHPAEVRTSDRIPKGQLELIPATDLKNVSTKRGPGGIPIHLDGKTFFVQEPSRARSSNAADWKSDMLFVPYWWVATTPVKEDANMVEKKVQVNGMTAQALTNDRILKPHEKLVVYKPKKEVVPLATADGGANKRKRT